MQLQHEGPTRDDFAHAAKCAFERKGVRVARIKTWVSVHVPETGEGYARGYPHIHYPTNAWTLVHYLDTGDVLTPLDVFDGGEIVESIVPEVGLTVFFRNSQLHGVRRNLGTTDRVQLIATALAG